MTRVGVISDTHAPRFWKSCPSAVGQVLRGGDVILHAGDVCTVDVLDDLSTFAPVHAVLGNNDGAAIANWGAPVVFGHSHIPWVELGEGFRVFNPGPPTSGGNLTGRTQSSCAARPSRRSGRWSCCAGCASTTSAMTTSMHWSPARPMRAPRFDRVAEGIIGDRVQVIPFQLGAETPDSWD